MEQVSFRVIATTSRYKIMSVYGCIASEIWHYLLLLLCNGHQVVLISHSNIEILLLARVPTWQSLSHQSGAVVGDHWVADGLRLGAGLGVAILGPALLAAATVIVGTQAAPPRMVQAWLAHWMAKHLEFWGQRWIVNFEWFLIC